MMSQQADPTHISVSSFLSNSVSEWMPKLVDSYCASHMANLLDFREPLTHSRKTLLETGVFTSSEASGV